MDQSPAIPTPHDVGPRIPSRADIQRLQAAVAQLPQVSLPTFEFFGDGTYVREMHVPAGVILVGAVHKSLHVFVLLKGRMLLTGDGSPAREVEGPFTVVSPPGVKRAGHAITDCICLNIHEYQGDPTSEAAWDALAVREPGATLDVRNQVRALT